MPDFAVIREVIDRVVVITLSSAHERQERVSALLGGFGLSFDFHFGHDFRDRRIEDLIDGQIYSAELRTKTRRSPMSSAEVGCALSHRDIAKAIADKETERVLVLEDDVCAIRKNLPNFPAARLNECRRIGTLPISATQQ